MPFFEQPNRAKAEPDTWLWCLVELIGRLCINVGLVMLIAACLFALRSGILWWYQQGLGAVK